MTKEIKNTAKLQIIENSKHEPNLEAAQEFVKLHPRPTPLETPIQDPVKVKPYENANWSHWQIKEIDNNQG